MVPPLSSWPSVDGWRWRNFSPSRLRTSIDDGDVDLELHDDPVLVEGDVADPADPDPADLDDVALVDAAGVAELGVVGRAAEARELAQVEGGGRDHRHQHQCDDAEPHDPRVVGLHRS